MRRLLLACFLALIMVGHSFGEEAVKEAAEEAAEEEHPVYKFPEIKPKILIGGGYRLFDLHGSERAAEFEYPHDSITFAGEFRALPFPHRIHLEVDFFNKKDYFWDASYAYKDIVFSRLVNKTSFHNLENITLVDLGTGGGTTIDIQDASKEYGVRTGINSVFLRFKTPDFPFHVYMDGMFVDKEGDRQQRFVGGSGYFGNLRRTTRERDVDWNTRNITVGMKSHLGPVEADVSHSEMRFDSGGDRVFFDAFSAGGGRAAGTFPHNLIPDFKGSTDTLKLHTSYTGKLAASLTLSKWNRENEESGAQSDYFLGSTDVVWMPVTRLTFFFKYRHKEADIDNPETAIITDLLNPLNTQTFSVRESISYKKDRISGVVRYRLFKGITANAEISHENTDREKADEWHLPETTVKDTVSLFVNARIYKNVKVRAKYIHEGVDDPAYNIEPDSKDAGVISVSWTPLPFLLTYLSYDVSKASRENVRYVVADEQVIVNDRNVSSNRLLGMIGFNILKNLSVGTSYSYTGNNTKQTVIYASDAEPFMPDSSLPYKEKVYTIATNVNYKPKENIDLTAEVNYTKSSAKFFPSADVALQPLSIADFSELKIRETEYRLSALYGFKGGWDIGVRYSYSKFDNVIQNPLNPATNGNAHIVLVSISKRWM